MHYTARNFRGNWITQSAILVGIGLLMRTYAAGVITRNQDTLTVIASWQASLM